MRIGSRVASYGLIVGVVACGATATVIAGEAVDTFGRIEVCPFGALRLVTDDGARVALAGVNAKAGDYVHVVGEINPNVATVCSPTTFLPRLDVDAWQLAFAGCGTLDLDDVEPQLLLRGGLSIRLAETGAFSDGEQVFVRGVFGPLSGGGPFLQNTVIANCGEAIGRIEGDGVCPQVRTSAGDLASVQNLGGFSLGDFVLTQGAASNKRPTSDGCPSAVSDNVTWRGFGGCGAVQSTDACGRNFAADPVAAFDAIGVRGLAGPVGAQRFVLGAELPTPLGCGALEVDAYEQLACVRVFGELVSPTGGGWLFSGDDGIDYFLETVGPVPGSKQVYVTGVLVSAANTAGTLPTVRFARVNAVLEGEFFVAMGFECTPLGEAPDGGLWTLQNLAAPPNQSYQLRGIAMTACPDLCPYPCLHVLSASAPNPIDADTNCDGVVSVSDIAPFVLALTDPAAYAEAFPFCDLAAADVNNDGVVTVGDISLFVLILTGKA